MSCSSQCCPCHVSTSSAACTGLLSHNALRLALLVGLPALRRLRDNLSRMVIIQCKPALTGEESSPSRVHELKLGIHPGSCQVHSADLKPADVVVSDIVDASRPGPLNLCSVVSIVQPHLAPASSIRQGASKCCLSVFT